MVTDSKNAALDDALLWIKETCMQMFVPGLADFGVTEADIPAIVEKAKNASSMKGNPVQLNDKELAGILANSMAAPIDGNSTLYL